MTLSTDTPEQGRRSRIQAFVLKHVQPEQRAEVEAAMMRGSWDAAAVRTNAPKLPPEVFARIEGLRKALAELPTEVPDHAAIAFQWGSACEREWLTETTLGDLLALRDSLATLTTEGPNAG